MCVSVGLFVAGFCKIHNLIWEFNKIPSLNFEFDKKKSELGRKTVNFMV